MQPIEIAQSIFRNCDKNADGTISLTEFAMTLFYLTKAPKEEKFRTIFKLLDDNGNGFLSSIEVINIIKHAYHIKGQINVNYREQGLRIFQNMDTNGDFNVDQEEFVRACLNDQEFCQLMEDIMAPMKPDLK